MGEAQQHGILGILLLVGAVVWSTHRTGRFLTQETEKLTAAAQAVARKELDSAVFSGAKGAYRHRRCAQVRKRNDRVSVAATNRFMI